jgi:hypothetical protein
MKRALKTKKMKKLKKQIKQKQKIHTAAPNEPRPNTSPR